MAYRMTSSEAEGHFCCFKLLYYPFNWKAHVACDININVKDDGLLKFTGSLVHWKSDNIAEMVQDRDVVTTGYNQEVMLDAANSSNCNELECP